MRETTKVIRVMWIWEQLIKGKVIIKKKLQTNLN